MAEMLSFKKINKTRKKHRCFACGKHIEIGQSAYAWTSVDGGILTSHLCFECGKDTETHCFSCRQCDDGDGYPENYIRETMLNDGDCEPCKRLKTIEISEANE